VSDWKRIAAESDGTAGAAALHLRSGQRASLHGDDRFPLASVCKLPIAMVIFEKIEQGKLSADQEIEIPAEDVVTSVSPIGEQWPRQKKWKLDRMVELMIAKSDNTAVQTLYRMGGGGAAITARLRTWGLNGIRIDRDERTAGHDAAASGMAAFLDDPRDTGTPNDTADLVRAALDGRRLRTILEATTTGEGRIKGLLPPGTTVGHKTGTTGTDSKGLNGSTNDAGFIRMPDGGDLLVAFYLKGSTRDLAAREETIARLARAAYDWALSISA
jgi:beta-lactamase class A